MFDKRVWIPILIVLLAMVGGFLFYGQEVANQEPIMTITPVEVERPATVPKPPLGETAESGHWHGEVRHATPHAPVAAPEAEAEQTPTPAAEFTDAQGAPVGNPLQANAQIIERAVREGKVKLFSKGTPEAHKAYETWKAWEEKAHEIRLEIGAVAKEHVDALALTEAEAERYETDENIQRKVARRVNAVTEKLNEVYRRQREHEEKRPPIPYLQ